MLVLLAAFVAASSTSNPAGADQAPRTMTVAAGPQYAKSALHCFFFGADCRKSWMTPATAEVLDFSQEAGGLSVVRRLGGRQTKALAIRGRDGRNYTFRGIHKDVSSLLPEDLRGTYAERVLEDQMAGQHPASELVARGLLTAVGIPCPAWRLVVLPDDPALGEFHTDFAGAIGMFAEYPSAVSETNPGFRGATKIINHLELYRQLQEGQGDQVDVTAFLNARLMDILMGDWDRHRKQWRWAKFPGSPLWTPIPEDRDQAFCRYEGLALIAGRDRDPRFQKFGSQYGSLAGLTSNGREQDRQLLTGLVREDFDRAASALEAQLTDAAIDDAVALMPKEWQAIDGPRLSRELKARRDALPEIARKYYRHLAGRVDVHMTDQAEVVEAKRQPNGDLDVSVRFLDQGAQPGDAYFHRVFHSGETDEVRLYALDGDDRFVVSGGKGPIQVRAVGGKGDDTLDDREGGSSRLSDSEGRNTLVKGPGTSEDNRHYMPPPPPAEAPWTTPRDFGRETWSLPIVGYGSDLGVLLGWGVETRSYGFRKQPYANRHIIHASFSFGAKSGRLDYQGESRRENRSSFFGLHLYVSGKEVPRYYGLGNDGTNTGDADYYKAQESQALVYPMMAWAPRKRTSVTVGPLLRFFKTDDDQDNFLNAERPYGIGDLGQVGVHGALNVDSRDNLHYPRRGVLLATGGTLWPKAWDVKSTFGEVNGNANAYLSIGGRLTLALRAGGKKVMGDPPYRDAAFIGGGSLEASGLLEPGYTLRGFRARRFAGDGSLYGNADLRLRLFRTKIVVPTHVGVFGLTDAGRVWLDGVESRAWHASHGGGIWLSPLNYRATFSAYIAHSKEGNILRAGSEFTF